MTKLNSYYHLLMHAEGVEHWEIKIAQIDEGKFIGSAADIQNNLSVPWTHLEVSSEKEAHEEIEKLIKKNAL